MPIKLVQQMKNNSFARPSSFYNFRDNSVQEDSPRQRVARPRAATSAAASATTTSSTPSSYRRPNTARGLRLPLPLRGPTASSRRLLPTSTKSVASSTESTESTGRVGGTRGSPALASAVGGTLTASPAASPPPTSPPTRVTPSLVSAYCSDGLSFHFGTSSRLPYV